MNCIICNKQLIGRQSKFCSKTCKAKQQNNSYESQQKRAFLRKKLLIERLGGKCSKCDYDKNYSALEFHHLDKDKKSFNLDSRTLSNSSFEKIERELKKVILVCSNCHAEIHHPHLDCKRTSPLL